MAPAGTAGPQAFRDAMQTIFCGALHTALAALPYLRRSPAGGRLGLVGPVGGLLAVPHPVPYSCAKASGARARRGTPGGDRRERGERDHDPSRADANRLAPSGGVRRPAAGRVRLVLRAGGNPAAVDGRRARGEQDRARCGAQAHPAGAHPGSPHRLARARSRTPPGDADERARRPDAAPTTRRHARADREADGDEAGARLARLRRTALATDAAPGRQRPQRPGCTPLQPTLGGSATSA
ncbi:hypothetical protein [Streptomyces sp. NPDC059378]|uniref:hypothetical protein n=1 Tax=Streptomyces sp. NPDC059378 TaxID=3346815 RepID=UPI003674D1C2